MPIALAANDRKKAPVTLDAGDDEISLDFPVLAASEITVMRTRAGATATLVLDTDYSVSDLDTAPGALVTLSPVAQQDDIYEVWGATEISRATVYANGGAYNPDQMNAEGERRILVEQELRRDVDRALLEPMAGGNYEAGERRITGLADPVDDQDAATKAYVITAVAGAVQADLEALVEDAEAAQAGAAAAQSGAEAAQTAAEEAQALAEAVAGGYADATVYGFGLVEVADAAALQAYAELVPGAHVQAFDAATAKLDVEDQVLTGGARVTSKDLGTPTAASTVTLDPGDCPFQHLTNNAAFTLAPGSNGGAIMLDITNGASAGAVTTSGWTKVTGDALTTTNGHKFRCHCSIGNGGSLLVIQALQ